MIVVIGHLKIPPEKMGEAKVAMRPIISETLKEPGCLAYSFSEDAIEAGTIRIAEKWESWEALRAHGDMPHLATWRAALKQSASASAKSSLTRPASHVSCRRPDRRRDRGDYNISCAPDEPGAASPVVEYGPRRSRRMRGLTGWQRENSMWW